MGWGLVMGWGLGCLSLVVKVRGRTLVAHRQWWGWGLVMGCRTNTETIGRVTFVDEKSPAGVHVAGMRTA
jgi:hypothetical protein